MQIPVEVIISRHAKKRLKQRVHKNVQSAANSAFNFGLENSELTSNLRKYIDRLYLSYQPTAADRYRNGISSFKIFNEYVYIFNDNVLVTVVQLPYKLVDLARRLTKEKVNKLQ